MLVSLPTLPSFEVWPASACNVSVLFDRYPAGVQGVLGAGDSEYVLWARHARVNHGQIAEVLAISMQARVDMHRDVDGEYAVVRAVPKRHLQFRPYLIDWQAIGYPEWSTEPIDYPIDEWLQRRGFAYELTTGHSQTWKRPTS